MKSIARLAAGLAGAAMATAAIVLAQFTALDRLAAGIFASTAVVGLIIGFAAQNTISNLIAGVLKPLGRGRVRLALATEHGGCANVWQFADMSQPADFALQQAQPWTSVRVVKASKAYFYDAPGAAHGKAYVVKGDGVGVRAAQPGWAQADFVGENSASSGWLRESDLYPSP